nr:transposase [Carbonactinospora thermoautotrophica]
MFLAFPPEIRKIIYVANTAESRAARPREATRDRGAFPTEQAAIKRFTWPSAPWLNRREAEETTWWPVGRPP